MTHDAFLRNANNGNGRVVDIVTLPLPDVMAFSNTHCICQILEFAVAVSLACLAVHRMIVDQEFHDVPSDLPNLRRHGPNNHPLRYRIGAGSHEVSHPLDLHHAHPARAFDA
jgi:hypothetical protein